MMSVNTHLTTLASALVLSSDEDSKISTSITTLNTRLSSHFGTSVKEKFKFGSSTRGTILPRKADENSDIDFMVVFDTSKETLKPQSYLTRLKTFAEKYYSTSEIKQSSPTMVLELQHIRFELVPAITDIFSRYQIPSPATTWSDWMYTDPNVFNQSLTDTNVRYGSQIKPLVRLVKYWNTRNGHHFASFDLEKYIVGLYFNQCSALKDYFYSFWSGFSCSSGTAQYIKDKVQKAKDTAAKVKKLENEGKATEAESELAKFLPSI